LVSLVVTGGGAFWRSLGQACVHHEVLKEDDAHCITTVLINRASIGWWKLESDF
jgi:hypothetical protein